MRAAHDARRVLTSRGGARGDKPIDRYRTANHHVESRYRISSVTIASYGVTA
jgi:hypothetical protein